MRDRNPFYVGYLAMPPAHRRFLTFAIPLTLLAMLGSAAALVTAQPPWGNGTWDIAAPKDFVGIITLTPYPALQTDEGVFLLVGSLKTAPTAEAIADAGFTAGTHATVRGYDLARDGRRIISLESDSPLSITPHRSKIAGPIALRITIDPAQRTTLTGEILDAKCYIGAMKPGYGRGHKACATTCIQGGIPPMLVTQGPTYHLLTRADGSGLSQQDIERIAPLIGEPISIDAAHTTLGAWNILAIDPNTAITKN